MLSIQEINLSVKLKDLRGYKNITLRKLAENFEIKYSTIEKYEFNNYIPQIKTLMQFASFFGVSIDFLLVNTPYIRNIQLLSLSEKIDKLDSSKRFTIRTTIETFFKKKDNDQKSILDTPNMQLSDSINRNITILREQKNISQKELSLLIGTSAAAVNQYETGVNKPAPENIVTLANIFNISIHALITGNALSFDFQDEAFKDTVLKADQQFSLEQHKFIIEIMANLLES